MGKFFVKFLQDSRFDLSRLCRILLLVLPRSGRASSKISVLRRVLSASQFQICDPDYRTSSNIELLFVATQKDFSLLPLAIQGALVTNLNDDVPPVTVVVPEAFVSECKGLLASFPSARVVTEDSIIPDDLREQVNNKFGARAGWVIQQIIKLSFVSESLSQGVLVIDSDTVFLQGRNWLANSTQALFPVWELHEPYYEFLRDLGWTEIVPDFTFVAHHMLMQPHILRMLFVDNQFAGLRDFLDFVLNKEYRDLVSPFSIDYELYGQHLYRSHLESVRLEKWSNLSVSRSEVPKNLTYEWLTNNYGHRFASVSLHSYL